MQDTILEPKCNLDEAREVLGNAIETWADNALTWHLSRGLTIADILDGPVNLAWAPSHLGVITPPGLGKTEAAIRSIVCIVREAASAGKPIRVLWLVPTHVLSSELERRIRALGEGDLTVATYRGLGASDPDKPDRKMCRNPKATKPALWLDQSIKSAACGKPEAPSSQRCRYRLTCPYWRQMEPLPHAQVVIAAHEFAFRSLPDEAGIFDLTVIDESFWQTGLSTPPMGKENAGTQDKQPLRLDQLHSDTLDRWPVLDTGEPDAAKTAELKTVTARLSVVLTGMPYGSFLSRRALVAAGLGRGDCIRAMELESARKIPRLLRPGMREPEREGAVSRGGINMQLNRRQAIWNICADLLANPEPDAVSGRLRIVLEWGLPAIALYLRREIRPEIRSGPVLHLDATAEPAILTEWLPYFEIETFNAPTPRLRVCRILGAFGKERTVGAPDEKVETLRKQIAQLAAGREALVITYKDAEEHFADLPGIQTTHFGALRGLNTWDRYRLLFIVGRPLPSNSAIHATMQALTGEPCDLPRLVWQDHLITVRGEDQKISALGFTDPLAETIRRAITDAEIIQAIGRLRAINLPPRETAEVWVLGDGALDHHLDACLKIPTEHNGFKLMEADRIYLESAAHAAKAGYFPSAAAARQADRRKRHSEDRDKSLKIYLRETSRTSADWQRVRYQLRGPGQKAAVIWVDSAMSLDATRAWLIEKLAPIKFIEALGEGG